MKRQALFIISSDPAADGRAAEALRVAGGILAWERVEVRVYLEETAALGLTAHEPALVDEAQVRQCLPMLGTAEAPILVAREVAQHLGPCRWEAAFRGISPAELASLAAASDHLLHF